MTSEKQFNESVRIVGEEKYNFPERFSNEIYFSESKFFKQGKIEYQSNFSIKYVFEGHEEYTVNGHHHRVPGGKMLVVNDQSHVINDSGQHQAFSVFINPDILSECLEGIQKRRI
jgi:hypothetical protein